MKHEAIQDSSSKQEWNVYKSKEASNMRVSEMLDNCSDEKCILLAETIAAHRLAGLTTHSLEERLKVEMSRMMIATKVFFGKTPAEVKYKYKNQAE